MPRNYLCRPRPRAFTPRAGSHKSHAIGAFAVRRYPPEAEYNTGGLARCSALEHTTCCLSPSPTSAEQIIFARPTKSLDIATATTTIALSPLCGTRLVSPDLQHSGSLRPGVGTSSAERSHSSLSKQPVQPPQQPERTHDAGTASLAHPPESIPSSYRPKLVIPEKRVVQSLNFCA